MKKYLLFILALSLFILGPSLFDGGILTLLDYAFIPHQTINWTFPLGQIFMRLLSLLLGEVIASKLFFLAILILSGLLGLQLARYFEKIFAFPSAGVRILAIFFFMCNPFAYERMLTQPQIYLGIILIGWGIYFLFVHEQSYLKQNILTGMSMGLALAFLPHAIYMIVLVYLLYLIAYLRSRKQFGYLIAGGVIILILNLNWILASFWGTSSNLTNIGGFDMANLEAFRSRALAPLGVSLTNLLLYGFWGQTSHYVQPGYMSPYWYIWGGIIFSIALCGGIVLYRVQSMRKWMGILFVLGAVSYILGLGIATDFSRVIITWAYDVLPYFRGYREPQKWIGILMIVQGIFFIVGTLAIFRSIKDIFLRIIVGGVLFLFILLWSPGMLGGFRGQLTTIAYPTQLETLRTELLATSPNAKILVLPWHSYMACEWTRGKVIANSIHTYFSPLAATAADNIEMIGKLYSNSENPESKAIESFLTYGSHDIQSVLKFGYTHILIMKTCASLETFPWLKSESHCKLLSEDPVYMIYTCQAKE